MLTHLKGAFTGSRRSFSTRALVRKTLRATQNSSSERGRILRLQPVVVHQKKSKRTENNFGDGVEQSRRRRNVCHSCSPSPPDGRSKRRRHGVYLAYMIPAAGRCGSFLFAKQVKRSRCRVTKRVQCARSSSSRRPRSGRE